MVLVLKFSEQLQHEAPKKHLMPNFHYFGAYKGQILSAFWLEGVDAEIKANFKKDFDSSSITVTHL